MLTSTTSEYIAKKEYKKKNPNIYTLKTEKDIDFGQIFLEICF